jgi:hypothetical protein
MIPKEFCEYVYSKLTDKDKELINQKVKDGKTFDEALNEVRTVIGFKDTRDGKFYPKSKPEFKNAQVTRDDGINEVELGDTDIGNTGLDNYEIDFDNEHGFNIE